MSGPRQAVQSEQAPGGSSFSFTVLLNPKTDFEGGGTYYEANDEVLQPDQGDILVHAGSMKHEGRPITKGVRYLMIGFLALKDDCYAGGMYENAMNQLHPMIAGRQTNESAQFIENARPQLLAFKNQDDDNGYYSGQE